MSAGRLLPELIARIFTYLNGNWSSLHDTWATQLPLLSICRKWRHVGVPFVYRHLYITAAADSTRNNAPTVTTNINLCDAQGYQSLCKALKMRLSGVPLHVLLKTTNKLLSSSRQKWNHVSEFSMCVEPLYFDSLTVGASEHASTPDESLNLHINQFTGLLPSISSLSLALFDEDTACSQFVDIMKQRYASQLVRMDGSFGGTLGGGCEFTKLESLSADFNDVTVPKRPCIRAKPLKHLRLFDLPLDQLWLIFYGEPAEPNDIIFENLKTMELFPCSAFFCAPMDAHFRITYTVDFCKRLYFPQLTSLRIGTSAEEARMIQYAHFPPLIQKLHICANGANAVVYNAKFGPVERGQLAGLMGMAECGDFWPLANFVSGNGLKPSYSTLDITYESEQIEPSLITS